MANILCRQHPFTADHISKLATLVDKEIGTLMGDAALKNKVADFVPWYELRGVIAQMQDSTGAKTDVPAEKKARTRTKQPATPSPALAKSLDTILGPEGEIGGTGGAE